MSCKKLDPDYNAMAGGKSSQCSRGQCVKCCVLKLGGEVGRGEKEKMVARERRFRKMYEWGHKDKGR